jgi:hypothetical protein
VKSVIRLAVALLPLALAPLFVYLIGNDWISFGGGEKDLVLVVPWLLWSILFALASFVLWFRRWTLVRSTIWSAVFGIAGLVVTAMVLAFFGQLGVGGRF